MGRSDAGRARDEVAYGPFLGAFAALLRRIICHRQSYLAPGDGEVENLVQEVLIVLHGRRLQWDSARPLPPG